MPLSSPTKFKIQCPPDEQLVLQLLGESSQLPALNNHLDHCPSCTTRQASLVDRAAAVTSLRFSPLEWEAFRSFRLQQNPVHQVALDLALSWQQVWTASANILQAIQSTLKNPDFFDDQLHASEITRPD